MVVAVVGIVIVVVAVVIAVVVVVVVAVKVVVIVVMVTIIQWINNMYEYSREKNFTRMHTQSYKKLK